MHKLRLVNQKQNETSSCIGHQAAATGTHAMRHDAQNCWAHANAGCEDFGTQTTVHQTMNAIRHESRHMKLRITAFYTVLRLSPSVGFACQFARCV
eukprot:122591-Pelagomonas_calceolata.AAC.2